MARKGTTLAALAVATLISMAWLPSAMALETRRGDDIVVGADEVIDDDLIALGQTVTIDGTVLGDVIASGTSVTVNGIIEGDLLAAAQTVVINGTVRDDARLAGMVLEIRGEIGDDLLAAALSLKTTQRSRISGAASFSGLQALWNGEVAQDLTIKANSFELNGKVGGSVDAEVGPPGNVPGLRQIPSPVPIPTVNGGLTVGDNASIAGDLEYAGPVAEDIAPGILIGGATIYRQTGSANTGTSLGARMRRGLARLLALMAVGSLWLWLAPNWTSKISDALSSNPQKSLALGIGGVFASGVLLLLVMAIAVLFSVLLGLVGLGSLGTPAVILGVLFDIVVIGTLYFAFLYFSQIAFGIAAGVWILRRFQGQPSRYLALFVGALGYVVLRQIPFLGLLVGGLVLLLGFGAMILGALRTRHESIAAPA